MAAIGDIDCVGLLIVRRVKARDSYKLQMLLLENNHGELTLPKDEIEENENEMVGAQRAVEDKIGVGPDEYDIFQEFGFVMEDNLSDSDCHKILYWIAFLKDGNTPFLLEREYKSFHWVDFSVIQNMGLASAGRLRRDIGSKLSDITISQANGISARIRDVLEKRRINF